MAKSIIFTSESSNGRKKHELGAQLTAIDIYYADDDFDDTFFFKNAVAEIGCNCKVHSFPTGIELLENLTVTEAGNKIVFLDLNMPLKNGLECLQDIRSDETTEKIPVFIISTSNSVLYREQAIELGATDYIEKPTSFKSLKSRIQEAISQVYPNP